MKDLLTGNQPSDDETADLKMIVELVAKQNTKEKNLSTSREILAVDPMQLNTHPDGALVMWLNALGSDESKVVDALLQANDLNEAQKERVYRYAVNRKNELGQHVHAIEAQFDK